MGAMMANNSSAVGASTEEFTPWLKAMYLQLPPATTCHYVMELQVADSSTLLQQRKQFNDTSTFTSAITFTLLSSPLTQHLISKN